MEKKDITKQTIKDLLAREDVIGIAANLRGLLRIYQYQTDSEKIVETTHIYNNVGFSGYDANFLTSLSKQFINKGFVTAKQFIHIRKNMKKYWRQLYEIAIEENTISNSIEEIVPKTNPNEWVRGTL